MTAMTPSENHDDGAPDSGETLPVGTRIGEYELGEVIGRGGFSTVYRAEQPAIAKDVAIKVLRREFAVDKAMVEGCSVRRYWAFTSIGRSFCADQSTMEPS